VLRCVAGRMNTLAIDSYQAWVARFGPTKSVKLRPRRTLVFSQHCDHTSILVAQDDIAGNDNRSGTRNRANTGWILTTCRFHSLAAQHFWRATLRGSGENTVWQFKQAFHLESPGG